MTANGSQSSEEAPLPAPFSPLRLLRGSFRAKLFAVVAALILAVSAALSIFFVYHLHDFQEERLATQGRLLAGLMAHNARLAVFADNREELREIASGVLNTPGVLSVTVFNRRGQVLFHGTRQRDTAAAPVHGQEAKEQVPARGMESGYRQWKDFIEFYEPVVSRSGAGSEDAVLLMEEQEKGARVSIGTVRVTLDHVEPHRQLRTMVATAAVTVAGFLAVGIAAAMLVIRGITRPLSHLAKGVKSVESGEKDIEIPVESHDEIGALAASFNRMVVALRRRKREQEEAADQIRDLNSRLEEKVRERTAQLEAANRELESFNYSASHDLRAPLTRLQGYCQALEEDYAASLDEQGLRYLGRIKSVGKQMEGVIGAMSTLFHVQRRQMESRTVDLSALVRAVFATLRESDQERNVTLTAKQEVTAWGDQQLLWLALENIVGNAWKFTARAAGAQIEFGELDEAGERVFFIRDNGVGFDMAFAHKLFIPFERLHGSDEFPGTGVGLAIVQRIFARHGGRVWLESAEGKGTTCFFTLPPRPPAEDAEGTADARSNGGEQ